MKLARLFTLILPALFASVGAIGQTQYWMNTDTTVVTCDGSFVDSGGPVSGTYSPNESYIYTFCPNSTSLISLNFGQFNLGPGDQLSIFNGNDTLASMWMGTFSAAAPLLGIIQATVQNPTGCMTIMFTSDGAGEASGWAAGISCVAPCQPFQAVLDSVNPTFNSSGVEIDICPGESVTFHGSGDYPNNNFYYTQSDALSTFNWDFDDGNTGVGESVTHTFPNVGAYNIALDIIDSNGCDNANVINAIVRVATTPDFSGTGVLNDTVCYGETNEVFGFVETQTYIQPWGNVLSDSLMIPDNVGVPYSTSVTLNTFAPGQTLTNINDLIGICINMEHSYLGDLNMVLECPSGQTLTLVSFPNGGGGTFLGEPVDFNSNPVPGIGYDYCFTPTPTYSTFSNEANSHFYTYTDVTGQTYTNKSHLPAGSYTPEDPLSNLVGCDLNGDWTITVVDNLGIDNGFIFSWYIDFDPSIFPNPLISYTPQIATTEFVNDPYYVSWTDTTATIQSLTPGMNTYTFAMTDDFGCVWTEDVEYLVLPSSHPDCHVCFPPAMSGTPETCDGAADGTVIATPIDSINIYPFPWTFQWIDDNGQIIATSVGVNGADTLTGLAPGTYTVLMTDSNGCGSSNDFIVTGPPPAVVVMDTVIDNTCFASCDGYAYVDASGGTPPFSYLWDNGWQTPYNSVLCEGTHEVTVTDANGCEQILTATVSEPPPVLVSSTPDTVICLGGTAVVMAQASGGTSPTYNFVWEHAPGFYNDTAIIQTDTNMVVEVVAVDTSGCQSGVALTNIAVRGPIKIEFEPTDSICSGESSELYATVTGGDSTYTYSWSNNTSGNPSIANPQETTTYWLTVNDGCETPTAIAPVTVYVGFVPESPWHVNLDEGCAPATFNFTLDNYVPGVQYHWRFGDLTDATTYSNAITHVFTNPGCYGVGLTTTTPDGCSETMYENCAVNVFPNPFADFVFNPVDPTNISPNLHFRDMSVGGDTYEWDMGDGNYMYDRNFPYLYADSGRYQVFLTVVNEAGCTDTITKTVTVGFETIFWLPNAFSPDGDGLNDYFGPLGDGWQTQAYRMTIFNRWGERIFTTNNPTELWDGTTDSGLVPVGVYPYLIHYTTHKGGDPEVLRGQVTVVR